MIGTGVDFDAFAAPPDNARSDDLVVFVGSMDWQPNEDAVLWFSAEVWPRVAAAVPGARFRIVGRRPPPSIVALGSDRCEVTHDVDRWCRTFAKLR